MTQNRTTIVVVIIFLIVTSFSLGVLSGQQGISGVYSTEIPVEIRSSETPDSVDFAPFWTAWNILNEKYVNPERVKDEDKVWGAIEGLAGAYDDPYTVFFPPREAEYFESEVRGNFGGIGIEIGVEGDILTVIAPLKGTPAERAGLLAGDKIISVNATSTMEMTLDEAISLIRGEIGTPVDLTIVREGEKEPREIEVIRDTINIPTIETEKRDDGVFVISLYNFSAVSPDLFRQGLREFVESGYDKLILDLRNNPGGYLEAAIDMASWFLPAGKVVVTEDFRNGGHDEIYRSKGYDIFNKNLKFVILLNKGSASASEILAAALHEYGVAKLIGEKSFGKGSVQQLLDVTPDTSLKVTVAEWLTPNGNQISGKGLTPDILVERTAKDYEKKLDPQMDKAVEALKNWK